MRMNLLALLAASLVASSAAVACGSDDANDGAGTVYTSEPNKTVIVGDGKGSVFVTPTGSDCITTASGECVKPQDTCKEGERADVIVDSSGKVVEVVCYPADATPTQVDDKGNVELGKGNKAVVALDGTDDGIDIAGDVTSSGNKVTVYGQGAGVSVIGGSVSAEGNNFAMRGVTVKKDVTITGNNATLVLCVIEGNVTIEGNNAVIAECTIHGTVTIKGNNTKLVSNDVAKTISVTGENTVCDGNVAWSDANGNGAVDPGESGAAVDCAAK